MSRSTLFSLLLMVAAGSLWAQPVRVEPYAGGTLLKTALSTAPFPAPSRAEGHDYDGQHYSRAGHYQDSTVAIFIPAGFERGDSADYIVHFHGWWNSVDSVLQTFELPEQLTAAGKNAILVIPQGPRQAPDSNGGKLEDAGAFAAFMQEVSRVAARHLHLRSLPPRHLILSGHSGGYRVMSYLLQQGGLTERIREVWLFDGLYGQLEKYAMWVERGGPRLVLLYTDEGGTLSTTRSLRSSLQAWALPFTEVESRRGESLPALPESGTVFWHTDLGHNAVLHEQRQFAHLLRSCSWLLDQREK
ncbi:MAG: hypothetical protein RIC19_09505 [Phaeodactylibacter sp.]|uniref:hypothetical protein n=1 Tax=Phaeodactylibacter sp. TaxID=1940289 RepID=UPI0032ED1353